MNKPLVSVIIPTHNRAQSLIRAIQSVLKQSFQNFEIIIVNDASSDDTVTILDKLAQQDARIHAIHQLQSVGGSEARNIGIRASQGEWIAFLDDDDQWLPQKLQAQMGMLAYFPNAVACSSGYVIQYPLGITRHVITPMHQSLETLLAANTLGGASVCLCKASVIKQLGGFDAELRSAQDWDVWVRLRQSGLIISVPKSLVKYQVHFDARISNNMKAKYLGARQFYFKHRTLMNIDARRANLKLICYIRSRQSHRSIKARLRNLRCAIASSSLRVKCAYLLSSLPRIMMCTVTSKN